MGPPLLTAVLLGIASIMGCEAGPDRGGAVAMVDHGPVDVRSLPRWALAGKPTVARGGRGGVAERDEEPLVRDHASWARERIGLSHGAGRGIVGTGSYLGPTSIRSVHS